MVTLTRVNIEIQQPGGGLFDRLCWYAVLMPGALGPLVRMMASWRTLVSAVTRGEAGPPVDLLDTYPNGAPFAIPWWLFWASLVPVLWITVRIMTRPMTGDRVVYRPWISWFLISAGAFSAVTTAYWFPGSPGWPRHIAIAGIIMAICAAVIFVRAAWAFIRDIINGEADWIEAMK